MCLCGEFVRKLLVMLKIFVVDIVWVFGVVLLCVMKLVVVLEFAFVFGCDLLDYYS